MEWHTIGHERIRELLDRQLAAQTLAHAYLFTGPSGVGKRTLALEFAHTIIKQSGGAHWPIEFSFADSSLEQVRELIHGLSFKPPGGKRQVAVLDAAETMSGAAANALLKTIEEPSFSTVLILIASRDNVLATIRSRCQVFQFGRLSATQMDAWVSLYGGGGLPTELVRTCEGSPGDCIVRTQSEHSHWDVYAAEFGSFLNASVSERLSHINQWATEDAVMLSDRMSAWLTMVYMQPAQYTNSLRCLSVLLEAWRRLQTNANKKLVLEYVCINIA